MTGDKEPSSEKKSYLGIDDEEIIDDIGRVADIVDGTPSSSDYSEHGKVSPSTVASRFGSWNEGVASAGLSANQRVGHHVSDHELLDDLKRVASDLGHCPTMEEYGEFGEYSPETLRIHFESYGDACESAGLTPREKGVGRGQNRG